MPNGPRDGREGWRERDRREGEEGREVAGKVAGRRVPATCLGGGRREAGAQRTDGREGGMDGAGREGGGGREVAGWWRACRVHLGHTCHTERPRIKCQRKGQLTDAPERCYQPTPLPLSDPAAFIDAVAPPTRVVPQIAAQCTRHRKLQMYSCFVTPQRVGSPHRLLPTPQSTHRLPRFSLYPYPVGTWTSPARTIWWERDRVSDRTYKSLSTTEPGVDSDENPTVRPVRRCPLQKHSFKQPSEARTK